MLCLSSGSCGRIIYDAIEVCMIRICGQTMEDNKTHNHRIAQNTGADDKLYIRGGL